VANDKPCNRTKRTLLCAVTSADLFLANPIRALGVAECGLGWPVAAFASGKTRYKPALCLRPFASNVTVCMRQPSSK
jgi:hypothetical protein